MKANLHVEMEVVATDISNLVVGDKFMYKKEDDPYMYTVSGVSEKEISYNGGHSIVKNSRLYPVQVYKVV